jgi:hypothetical protein
MGRYNSAAAIVATFLVAVAFTAAAQTNAKSSTVSNVTVRTLAQAPVPALPAGKVFVAVLEFNEVPGAACGPTCFIPGFVYTLRGVVTVSFPGAGTQSVGPGDGAFTRALAVHSNANFWERVGAGAVATGLIVIAILLFAATWLRSGRRRATIAFLSLLLIAVGVLGLSGAMSNDWYYFAVRPIVQRSSPMVRPDGRVTFLSPQVDPVPAAPYLEMLSAITLPPGARYDSAGASGPQTIIVVEGTAAVHVGDAVQQLSSGGGAFAQMGTALTIENPGTDTLQVIDFAISSASSATSAASPLPSPSPPPGGGPVPAQLLGDWFLPPVAHIAISGNGVCPSPATLANCFLRLTLTATTFHMYSTDTGGKDQLFGNGEVVVNNNEIDVFNGICPGVGRYKWTLTGGRLHFTLNSDPCGRSDVLAYEGNWSRTP